MCAGRSCTTCATGWARRPRSRRSGSLPALVRLPRPEQTGVGDLVEEFARRCPNPKTASDYRSELGRLFRSTGVDDPSDLRECDLIAFCTAGDPANHTVYQRASKVCTFLAWCQREGHIATNPAAHLREVRSPLRTYRRTYGKVLGRHPGRWLTYEEADGRLVGSCRDGTVVGLRDELVIRLGLLGLRLSEIGALRLDNLHETRIWLELWLCPSRSRCHWPM